MAFRKIPEFLASEASWSSPKADYFGNVGAVCVCVCMCFKGGGGGVLIYWILYVKAHVSKESV